MMNSDTSYPYQNNGPRRPHLSSTAFSEASSGFPGKMATGGSMDSRGPPDHLPTGPLALLPRLHGFNNTVYYSDAPATTPSGTSTQRDLLLQLRRTPWEPEPDPHPRQELITDSSDATVRDNPKDTPEGSTEMLVIRYTAGRVITTATPPHRVLRPSDFAFFD